VSAGGSVGPGGVTGPREPLRFNSRLLGKLVWLDEVGAPISYLTAFTTDRGGTY
jgi:hypothetical protein